MKLADLKKIAKNLPSGPGVYLFKSADGTTLYIGKASNLRNRVLQYFAGKDPRPHIQFLVKKVDNLIYFETDSPESAVILERDLIKKYQPCYNIKEKDDSGNVHISIDLTADWPYFQITNNPKPGNGKFFFGPLPSKQVAKRLIEGIRLAYPIRNCPDSIFHNRIRPCIEYELGRCLGPCVLNVPKEEYLNLIEKSISTLRRENTEVIEILSEKLNQAAQELKFEDCIVYRGVIESFTNYASKGYFHRGEKFDFISGVFEGEKFLLTILSVIGTKIVDIQVSPLSLVDYVSVDRFLEHHYGKIGELPACIYVDPDLKVDTLMLECFIYNQSQHRVEVKSAENLSQPHMQLIKLAKSHAIQYLKSSHYSKVDYQVLAEKIKSTLGLSQTPVRIECLDVSNFGDWGISAGFSVFIAGEPKLDEYIILKLKQRRRDDYASIQQAINLRVHKEKPLFDLLVIDGGYSHLEVALKTFEKLGLNIPVVAIAKKREKASFDRLYLPGRKDPVILQDGSLLHSFFASLRDEAHRLANTFTRYLKKRSLRSELR